MGVRVIFADDDENFRGSLIRFFKSKVPADVEVIEVPTGESLVDKVKSEQFNLVFTDYDLGKGMNGVDAIKAIRADNPQIPIYMVSASKKEEEAMLAGATGYFDKTFNTILSGLESAIKKPPFKL